MNVKTKDSSDKKATDDKELKECKEIGDIDELIFPDDEPRYVSER